MLSPEAIEDIHYQLNHIPSSFTNKKKRELRQELNKVLKEHKYASTYVPFKPLDYQIVFVNRTTSTDTLIALDEKIKQTNTFAIDTESVCRKFQPNVPSLIQLQICSKPSSIMIIEVQHLPKQNEKEFKLIKNLFNSLFVKQNNIFIWGEMKELEDFIQFDLFNHQQIYLSTNRNVQKEFKIYWNEVYPHNEDSTQQCQCKYCFGIDHDNLLSLQDAVAFQLHTWLDKRLTRQAFNIGLDPQLKRLNERELDYRKSLLTYAANDCDAIYQIILHSNLINDCYPQAALINKINYDILMNEGDNEIGDNTTAYEIGNNTTVYEFGVDEFDYAFDDEIIINEQGQVAIAGASCLIINSNNRPTTTPTIIRDQPPKLETISSDDEETMDNTPKQEQLYIQTKSVKPGSAYDNQPTHIVRIDTRSPPPATNRKPTAPRTEYIKYTTALSEAERKKIHNRSRTRHQRIKAYAQEIILFNIERRFPVKIMKQILKQHGILITQINPVESMRTGQIILYIGIKQPVEQAKYDELQELFTYQNYRRLFPHKFKNKQRHHHRRNSSSPRAYERNQRYYR